ncbi:MAG: hypothetical protein JHC76_05190 [Akkermansiaceae bacterium]|nr:hypothetical protein [Akkermansiaceae bacterium]
MEISLYSFEVLRSLRLIDFRCFHSLDLEVPAEGAILVGDNAQGKTSILEALCVLVRLHSPRTHRMATLGRLGAKGFGIAGDLWGTERQFRYSRDGLLMKVETETILSQTRYLEAGGLVVWMGNEDLELVRGPGEGRRRYLDFLGAQIDPAYRRSWSRYRRALRAKNLLLKRRSSARCRNYVVRGNFDRARRCSNRIASSFDRGACAACCDCTARHQW